jgi:hypothetical protein
MARITTTNQKKNTMIPGMAYPATVLALATAPSYPAPPDLSQTGASSATGEHAVLARGMTALTRDEPVTTGAVLLAGNN